METDRAHDRNKMLSAVPKDGRSISNPKLREHLHWASQTNAERYYRARQNLVDSGDLQLGRGRGGTVSRTNPFTGHEFRDEHELYGPLKETIRKDWALSHGFHSTVKVEITADQGQARTGGVWSRPDITVVDLISYAYVPGQFLELVTFEVKMPTDINVRAVYEALAQRRSATRSYVVFYVPDIAAEHHANSLDQIVDVARAHGIGVIEVPDTENFDTWNERVPAGRSPDIDPSKLNQFIARQMPEHVRQSLESRIRR